MRERSTERGYIIKPDGSKWVWDLLADAYVLAKSSGAIPATEEKPAEKLGSEELPPWQRYYQTPRE